ncbi:IS4 family transposase [Actinosynnema sp. CS-041913]|uniref:IS4 family transposase n=1 Tax=Actinosynnema sp. CS-041913 TaxID=3239917 RepID=UPI003D8FB5E0
MQLCPKWTIFRSVIRPVRRTNLALTSGKLKLVALAHMMVSFCLAMCLFSDDDYEEVMRKLVGSLEFMRAWRDGWSMPSTAAITLARQRLGEEPLKELFSRSAVPVAAADTRGAWSGTRRLMAVDGFVLDVADTPGNMQAFGTHNSGARAGAFPQARVVGLGECGSRAIVAATIGSSRDSENIMVGELLSDFGDGMLVLADRHFYGYRLWNRARATGADLLWRINSTVGLEFVEWLPDGSWLAYVIDPEVRSGRRRRLLGRVRAGEDVAAESVTRVRVVEYEVTNRTGNGQGEPICLITTILDPSEASAVELAAAYHERWEFETGIGEVKTRLRGSGRVLRSKSPEMVRQEIWAFLLTHYAIRKLMCAAAGHTVDPDRLSFTRSLRVVRRHVTRRATFSPQGVDQETHGDVHGDPGKTQPPPPS